MSTGISKGLVAFLIAAASAASPLLGQTTWIVDASNGPGTNFTDLPPAFARASDGDTILVRAGSYTPGTASRALTILGQGGVVVNCVKVTLPPQTVPFVISGVGSGKTFVLRGITFAYNWSANDTPILQISGNGGRVQVEDCQVDGTYKFGLTTDPLRVSAAIDNCSQVSVTRCVIGPSLRVSNSTVCLSKCTLDGRNAGRVNPTSSRYYGSSAGLYITSSTALLCQTNVAGGNGYFAFMLTMPGVAGIVSYGSDVVITGDSSCAITAGGDLKGNNAILGSSGGLLLDPSVQLRPTGSATPYAGFANSHARRLPALTASGPSSLGGRTNLVLYSQDKHLFVAMLALPGSPFLVAPFGLLWLDVASLHIFAQGAQGASEHTTVSLPIPSVAGLRGLPITFQVLSQATDAAKLGWALSPPVDAVLH